MKKIFIVLILIFSFISKLYAENSNKILIVYFSMPESIKTNGIDGVASASVQYFNGEKVGNTEKIAKIIRSQTRGDIYRIETLFPYPTEHNQLVDYAEAQNNKQEKPALKNEIDNLDKYNTIFLGYPIWWYGFPMPVLSFLDKYDLSGKVIIPFSTHGGSRFSGTVEELKELEPQANISENGLTISRRNVKNSDLEIENWLKKLGY